MMMRRIFGWAAVIGLVLCLGLLPRVAQAAPVEEMQLADRFTFESDSEAGTKYPVVKCENCVGGGGSGGTQYSQGTAAADTDQLTMLGCVRADTAAVATGVAALDRARCIVDSANRLWVRPTGSVSPGAAFANPTDAITAWSLNGCWNGSTWDPCPKGSAGAGTIDATTARVTLASDDPSFTGTSNDHYVSVGTTEDEHQVKATAGRLIAIQASNSAATVAYLRCANLTAANTTPGTSTVFWGMAIPGATTGAGMAAVIGGQSGLAFSTALTCWVVTDKAENGVTEVAAGDVQWNIQYK